LTGEFVGLGDLGDEEREGLVASAGLEFVDAVDGLEIDGIDGETVEGVGGEGDDVAAAKAGDDVADERGLGFVGMDAEGFGRQNLAPVPGYSDLCGPVVGSKTAVSFFSILLWRAQ
jgi:hypothetical protein